MDERAGIDRRLDELLVSLAGIVLRLAKPDVIRSVEEYRALAQSVRQYCICAALARSSCAAAEKGTRTDVEAAIVGSW